MNFDVLLYVDLGFRSRIPSELLDVASQNRMEVSGGKHSRKTNRTVHDAWLRNSEYGYGT